LERWWSVYPNIYKKTPPGGHLNLILSFKLTFQTEQPLFFW